MRFFIVKTYFTYIAILLLSLFGGAFMPEAMGQGLLEGYVTDTENKALEMVTVAAKNGDQTKSSTTDERGYYKINLEEGEWTIIFRQAGFQEFQQKIQISAAGKTSLNCTLKTTKEVEVLKAAEVTADRSGSGTFTSIDLEKIENVAGPTEGVEALLKTLPDVASNNELSSQYSVRGGSFDENLVYINGVEIYRPQLVRSGQQEGMSIINPDMVDHLMFSPGGFESRYDDKMSSVLDISYKRPRKFSAKLSGSLLGASAFVEGTVKRFYYSAGFRQHSNRYIFSTLDTKGHYSTSYTDFQTVMGYSVNDKLDLTFLGIWTRNRYSLIPESQTTTFGSFMESLQLDVYFDGQERDSYNTLLGSLTADYHPNEDFNIKWSISAQQNNEKELYDIQDQYWLYELALGSASGEVNKFDRGVGTFLEHARNYLNTGIYSTEAIATHYARLGSWKWGIKMQMERIHDRVNEWKWVDSAGYSMPFPRETWGDSSNIPYNPLLQFVCKADNTIYNVRAMAFVQRELNWVTRKNTDLRLLAGVRAQYYSILSAGTIHSQPLISPRLNFNIRPNTKARLLFRLAAGVYQQPPFYREMRRIDGSLNLELHAQRSYQAMHSIDWDFALWHKPFRLTADIYYKYIDNLVPYTVENLRVRYAAQNIGTGYAYGLSLRLNGEFVEGLESWASISLMQTREKWFTDSYGWTPRPTDQLFSFKMFLQDYLPKMPWWRMSLSLVVGTGTPVSFPYQVDRSQIHRLPTYFRVDWGNSVQLSRFKKLANTKFFRTIDDIAIGIDIFNLFNYHNVVSYLWVADYQNTYYPVPNYLTGRQINVKITISF